MNQQKTRILLWLLAVAAIVIGSILFAASEFQLASELLNVAMLLVGVVTMGAVSILQRFLDAHGGPLVHITFNEARTRSSLNSIIDAEVINIRDRNDQQPWEPTNESLLVQDPALALAKLRIDIERELRKLAFESDISVDLRGMSIVRLLDILLKAKAIPVQTFSAIREILPICNEAMHGGEIDVTLANSVLAVGADILALLQREKKNQFHGTKMSKFEK